MGCASGSPSSKLVGSSPVSIHDKWSGLAFKRPDLTMTSKSYSCNSKSHLHTRPPTQAYSPGISMRNGWCTSWNVLQVNSVGIFGACITLPTPCARWWNSFFLLWTIFDLQMESGDQCPLHPLMWVRIPMQYTTHQHVHEIPHPILENPSPKWELVSKGGTTCVPTFPDGYRHMLYSPHKHTPLQE